MPLASSKSYVVRWRTHICGHVDRLLRATTGLNRRYTRTIKARFRARHGASRVGDLCQAEENERRSCRRSGSNRNSQHKTSLRAGVIYGIYVLRWRGVTRAVYPLPIFGGLTLSVLYGLLFAI